MGCEMKRILLILLAQALLVTSAFARDTVHTYPVGEVLSQERAKRALGSDVKFYFGNQRHGKVVKNFGEFHTNKKTNAANKTDKQACQWVFLSAMKSLKERAIREGGNAVINIRSNYKGTMTTSNNSFQCGAGQVLAGVALVGTVVKLEE